jgi:hypothetical protein
MHTIDCQGDNSAPAPLEKKMTVQERARSRCHWLPELERLNGPLYKALVDQLASDIASGTLKPGDRLPPQRLLADALQVTLGTITRAYREAAAIIAAAISIVIVFTPIPSKPTPFISSHAMVKPPFFYLGLILQAEG